MPSKSWPDTALMLALCDGHLGCPDFPICGSVEMMTTWISGCMGHHTID